ncbi:MAG TPA: UdgX family uracil-DNA binding protein [Kofleriaceae bacterium]|nr:UdgX family uracil-DNA binding protein [Kofleriaceae bacterium]
MAVRARQPKPSPEEVPGAESFLPALHTLPTLRAAIPTCRGCTLYKEATQAVFGEGSSASKVMLIGEVPGDYEDLAGKPFVGPSGKLLDEALALAGIPRNEVYVTNAVKHFKFTRRGKRRLHDKPNRYEIRACKPWLESELEVIEPEIVVLLGATAAQALLGSSFRVTKSRGQALETELAKWTFATVHPAAVLRAPDEEMRRIAKEEFIADFDIVGEYFKKL